MKTDRDFFVNKINRLSQALWLSVGLNIGVLALLSYWIVRERPPNPYCEMKPASLEQQLVLADYRNCVEVLTSLKKLPFSQLFAKLSSTKLVENGYTERDLALSILTTLHHFDIKRALSSEPQQKRYFKWKTSQKAAPIHLVTYPGLSNQQFDAIIQFAKTERWPMTSEGQFLLLKKQKEKQNIDATLIEAFTLTPEFLTVELLFNHTKSQVRKQKLLEFILEGSWSHLNGFSEKQRQLNDLSIARRQQFILDYVKLGSETAAYLLLDIDSDFALKKLDDNQVISLLQLLPNKTKTSETFALSLLESPRSSSVWQQASLRLYEYAGEPIPKNWNYQTSLKRFAPHLALAVEANPKKTVQPVVKKPAPVIVKKEEVKKAAASAPAYRQYIIQEGDSLWKISRRFNVDMEVLKKFNKLKSNSIKPGTVLKIP